MSLDRLYKDLIQTFEQPKTALQLGFNPVIKKFNNKLWVQGPAKGWGLFISPSESTSFTAAIRTPSDKLSKRKKCNAAEPSYIVSKEGDDENEGYFTWNQNPIIPSYDDTDDIDPIEEVLTLLGEQKCLLELTNNSSDFNSALHQITDDSPLFLSEMPCLQHHIGINPLEIDADYFAQKSESLAGFETDKPEFEDGYLASLTQASSHTEDFPQSLSNSGCCLFLQFTTKDEETSSSFHDERIHDLLICYSPSKKSFALIHRFTVSDDYSFFQIVKTSPDPLDLIKPLAQRKIEILQKFSEEQQLFETYNAIEEIAESKNLRFSILNPSDTQPSKIVQIELTQLSDKSKATLAISWDQPTLELAYSMLSCGSGIDPSCWTIEPQNSTSPLPPESKTFLDEIIKNRSFPQIYLAIRTRQELGMLLKTKQD